LRQAIWVLLAACDPATAGISDSSLNTSNPTDGTDKDTDNPSGVVWVDAEGTVVEEVVELPEGLAFEDEFGLYWALDPNGEGAAVFVNWPDTDPVREGYADAGCSEPRIIADQILAPRYVMRGAFDDPSFAAQDDAVPEQLTYVYERSAGNCVEILSPSEVLTYDDVIAATMPEVYWVPPLHPETL
jgi:hypothetical protein